MCTELRCPSSEAWLDAVLSDFDSFLLDHAANERKASAMAMSLVAHYPDRSHLVTAMVDLALEELNHFRQVLKLMADRNLQLGADEKDPYVGALRAFVRKGADAYFMDRLLCAAVIELRGTERFSRLARALPEPGLARFYQTLARSEANHYRLFLDLACNYFPEGEVKNRWDAWLAEEATVVASLPVRARLH